MATTADDVWRLLGELVTDQKETERIIKEQFLETERRFQEIEYQIKEIKNQISNPLDGVIELQPVSMMIELFQGRGIEIEESSSPVEVKRLEGSLSIDIFLSSATEVVLIQKWTELTQRDVDEHLHIFTGLVWDINTKEEIRTFSSHESNIITLAIHPEGKILASSYEDKAVRKNNFNNTIIFSIGLKR